GIRDFHVTGVQTCALPIFSPFAWSRLIGTIPQDTEQQRARVAKIREMTPEKIAPMAVYLCSDDARERKVSGQIFVIRNNEIFLKIGRASCRERVASSVVRG